MTEEGHHIRRLDCASVAPICLGLPIYGLLFGRIPPEIRRQILVAAFGSRTMHAGLRWDHPLVRES
ncbi:hypothetical protein GGR56DRAFT_678686 [Xylariaceae sp. FL0804]|nr:hypothetical protein GGR56DRAFT_678686 [Xylariaceae sp. FL0804]